MEATTLDKIYLILKKMGDIDEDLPKNHSERDLSDPKHKKLICEYSALEEQLRKYTPFSLGDLIDYHNFAYSRISSEI